MPTGKILTTEQLLDKTRLRVIADLLRSATGEDRKELLEEQEQLREKFK